MWAVIDKLFAFGKTSCCVLWLCVTLRCPSCRKHYKQWLCGVLIIAKARHVYQQTAHKPSAALSPQASHLFFLSHWHASNISTWKFPQWSKAILQYCDWIYSLDVQLFKYQMDALALLQVDETKSPQLALPKESQHSPALLIFAGNICVSRSGVLLGSWQW